MTSIVVLGSTNMDLVAYVPRAPALGETVTGRSFRTIPGGKGANQAVAAARAGGEVALIGAVGADDFGARLRATLEHCAVDTDLLRTAEGSSGTAHIVVDDEGGNAIVVVPGANGTVTSLTHGDEALIGTADILLLQLELPLSVVVEGAATARRLGVRTVLTPAPAQPLPPELLASIDVLVPNEHEAAALTGLTDPRQAAQALLRDVPEVVVTLGRPTACTRREAPIRSRCPPPRPGRGHHRGGRHLRRRARGGPRRGPPRPGGPGLGAGRRRALRAARGRVDLDAVPRRDRGGLPLPDSLEADPV